MENGKYLTILFIQTNLYDLNNTKKYFLAHTMMFAIMIIGGTGKISQTLVRDINYCYRDGQSKSIYYEDKWWYWEDQSGAGKRHQLVL